MLWWYLMNCEINYHSRIPVVTRLSRLVVLVMRFEVLSKDLSWANCHLKGNDAGSQIYHEQNRLTKSCASRLWKNSQVMKIHCFHGG